MENVVDAVNGSQEGFVLIAVDHFLAILDGVSEVVSDSQGLEYSIGVVLFLVLLDLDACLLG